MFWRVVRTAVLGCSTSARRFGNGNVSPYVGVAFIEGTPVVERSLDAALNELLSDEYQEYYEALHQRRLLYDAGALRQQFEARFVSVEELRLDGTELGFDPGPDTRYLRYAYRPPVNIAHWFASGGVTHLPGNGSL